MGLFKKKNVCSFCGSDKKVDALKDGYICKECWKKCGHYGGRLMASKDLTTLENVKEKIKLFDDWKQIQAKRKAIYNPNIRIGNALIVDERNKLWQCKTGLGEHRDQVIYSLDEVIDYTLEEVNGDTVTKGGTSRAVVGGLAFGGAGAITGGVTGRRTTFTICLQMYVVVTLANYEKTYISLMPCKSKTSGKGSTVYAAAIGDAKQIMSYFDKVIAENTKSTNTSQVESTSIADELKKYSDLHESGVLSETEYNEIKEKLISKL